MSTTEEPETDLQLSEKELKALADQVAPQLEPGQYGSNMVLPRRTVVGVAMGVLSASALLGWGAGSVAGQEDTTWNVGDPDNPANVYGGEGRFDTLSLERVDIDDSFKYAGSDTELDDVLSDASGETTLLLGPAEFSDNRDIDTRLHFIGCGGSQSSNSTRITGEWTFNNRGTVHNLQVENSIIIDAPTYQIGSINIIGSVDVNDDGAVLHGVTGDGSITFDSGTKDGTVGSRSSTISVSDPDENNNVMPLS